MSSYLGNIVPAVVTMLFMSIYTTVDGLFVGWTVGTDAMAAINISYPIMNVMFALAFGLASGGSIRIATALGEGKDEAAGERFAVVIALGLAASILFIAAAGPFLRPILRLLGATDELMGYCMAYGGIALISYPIGILKEILTYLLRLQGMPGISMAASVAGGLANILLDYLFIVPFGWGVTGAAAATSLGMLLTLLADIWFLARRGSLRPRWPGRGIWAEAGKIAKLSVSGGVLELSYAAAIWYFNRLSLSLYQEDGVAAYTVIGYIQYALSAVFIGLGNGISPMISYYNGAGDQQQCARIIRKSLRGGVAAGIALFLGGYLGAGWLTGIFLRAGTLPYGLAEAGSRWIAFSCLLMGANVVIASVLNAYGDGRLSALLTFLRTVAFLMLGAGVLTRYMGYQGMAAAYVLAELLALGVSAPLAYRRDLPGIWKPQRRRKLPGIWKPQRRRRPPGIWKPQRRRRPEAWGREGSEKERGREEER